MTDHHDAIEFLQALFEPDDLIEIRLIEDQSKPAIQEWMTLGDLIKRLPKLEAAAKRFQNVYFGVCPRKRRGGKKADVACARTLWADVDDAKPAGSVERARAAGLPEPSIVVGSGRGTHLYWLLDVPVEFNTALGQMCIEEANSHIKTLINGDHVANIDRILRIPTFLNVKNARNGQAPTMCELVTCTTERYRIEEFLPVRTTVKDETAPVKRVAPPPSDTKAHVISNVRTVLAGTVKGQRSPVDFKEVCKLIEAGVPQDEAWDIVHDLSKFASNGRSYFNTTWANASASVAQNAPTVAVVGKYPLTEMGFAERMVDEFGDRLRYCNAMRWLYWNGIHWERDERGMPATLAKQTIRNAFADVAKIEDEKKRDAVLKEVRKFEANFKVKGIVELATSDQRIRVMAGDLDADPWAFNCTNGTVDLRTGTLRPHRQSDLLTKCASVAYDPAATCPRWEQFVDEIFNGDVGISAFVQRIAGYSLTGDTREQVLFFLYGTGANGKTVLLRTLQKLWGGYAQTADASTFMVKRSEGVRNDVARLAGARLVASVETDEGERLAESLVKTLTGGDQIAARFLHREFFEFVPQLKLWMGTNHRPVIRGGDFAIWRRIHLIPFNVRFEGDRADRNLQVKLESELPGILCWAITGLTAWMAGGLRPPQAVLAATAAYRDASDVLAEWIEARCLVGQQHEEQSKALYSDYHDWAFQSGERALSKNMFTRRLSERGIGERRTGRARWCVGLSLLATDQAGDTCDTSAPISDDSLHAHARREIIPSECKSVTSVTSQQRLAYVTEA